MSDGLPLLLAVCGAVSACGQSAAPSERTGAWFAGGLAFSYGDAATLVALDAQTGHVRFRYRRDAPQASTIVRTDPPELLCAPQVANGRVLLRYADALHQLDADSGRLEWVRECTQTACPKLCSGLLDDGSVAIVTGSGKTLTRIGREGTERWTRPVPAGPVVEAPLPVPEGVLVRTKTALVRFDRAGDVTWSEAPR